MSDRHNKGGSDDEAAAEEISFRTPPKPSPVAELDRPADRHDHTGIFWTDNEAPPPLKPNRYPGDPADFIAAGNLKDFRDIATLEDRHSQNLPLIDAVNEGQTEFTPEPSDKPSEAPTISMSPTPKNETDIPTAEPTITMMPTTPAPTITHSPTITMSPTISPRPTVTQEPTFTQPPTITMMPTEQGPTPRPTPRPTTPRPTPRPTRFPTGTPTFAPTSVCFSTRRTQGVFGDIEAEGSLLTVPYRYEVELLPDGTPSTQFQQVNRPDGWGWGSGGGTASSSGAFQQASIFDGRDGGRRRMAVPQDLLSHLVNVETLGSDDNKSRRMQDDTSQTSPQTSREAIAALTNEILPNVEILISDSLLPVVFEDECGQFARRKRARSLQQEVDVIGMTPAPPDSPLLADVCQVIVPEGENTCTAIDGALRLRVAGNVTNLPGFLLQDVLDTIREGMGPTGSYRAADGRIVRMAYTPGIIPGVTAPDSFSKDNDDSTIPAYPFVLVALLIAAMIGALVFYRKRHLTREMQMYDEDGNPLGSSAYEESGYAPPGNMLEDGDGYDDGTFDEYGDSLAGSQQPGGYATLEDDNYGDDGDGYGDDDGGYADDGYNDGDGGGGFDTIEEGNEEEDWGNEYGEEDGNESQKQDDEFSNQWE